jgi:hypothetical protein
MISTKSTTLKKQTFYHLNIWFAKRFYIKFIEKLFWIKRATLSPTFNIKIIFFEKKLITLAKV